MRELGARTDSAIPLPPHACQQKATVACVFPARRTSHRRVMRPHAPHCGGIVANAATRRCRRALVPMRAPASAMFKRWSSPAGRRGSRCAASRNRARLARRHDTVGQGAELGDVVGPSERLGAQRMRVRDRDLVLDPAAVVQTHLDAGAERALRRVGAVVAARPLGVLAGLDPVPQRAPCRAVRRAPAHNSRRGASARPARRRRRCT